MMPGDDVGQLAWKRRTPGVVLALGAWFQAPICRGPRLRRRARAMKTERLSLDCLVAAYAMGVCQVGRETLYRKQKLKLYQLRSAFLRANGQRFGKSEANVDRKQNYGARPVISKVPWLNLVGKNRLFWMRLAKKHELQPSSAQRAGC